VVSKKLQRNVKGGEGGKGNWKWGTDCPILLEARGPEMGKGVPFPLGGGGGGKQIFKRIGIKTEAGRQFVFRRDQQTRPIGVNGKSLEVRGMAGQSGCLRGGRVRPADVPKVT